MATRQISTAPPTPGVVSLGDSPARTSDDLPDPLAPITSTNDGRVRPRP